MDPVSTAVQNIIARFQAAKADGKVTFAELFDLVFQSALEIVGVTKTLSVPGAEKKQAALTALEQVIDQYITPLDIQAIPNWIEPVFDQGVKALLMAAADGAIEAAVSFLHKESQ